MTKIGKRGTCKSCGRAIVWTGKYWDHVNGTYRHIAEPKTGEKGQIGLGFAALLLLAFAIAITAVLVWGMIGLMNDRAAATCANTAEIMGVEYQWSSPANGGAGCMIEVDGRWMPLDAYYYNPAGDAPPQ